MKTVFWLLDINYEERDHKPEVWLWGINDKQERVLIIDRNFPIYFYLVMKDGQNPQSIIRYIESRGSSEFPFAIKLETVERRYFGKPVSAVKVVCKDPDVVPKYAKAMAKIEGVRESLEDDIRYSTRYLIDNDMSPCGWHEIEVEPMKNTMEAHVDKVYNAKSFPKNVEKTEFPQLRVLGFSTLAYSPKGAPKPEKDPVVIVSVVSNTGEEIQFVAKNSQDKIVLDAFLKYVRDFDPDILVGYGTNRQDWPYLSTRAKKLGVNLYVGRTNAEPHMSVYGHVSVTGRANVDFFDFSDELPEVKVKTLRNIADFLNVKTLEKSTLVEEVDYAGYWEDSKKRSTLLKFSEENAQSALGVADAMLSFAMQLSNLVGLPLDHVGTAAVGFRVECYLIREAYKIGELIPKRVERPYIPYVGAVVLAPKPGVHENIAVLDFKAMYPSIMITHNVSPDTYVPQSEPDPPCGVNIAPEVKHRFRKEPPGFYKQVLSRLIAYRDQIRPKLNKLDSRSSEYRVLDSRQKAVKVITNAAYGYTGWIGARWYIKPVAEAATAWGRYTIMSTIDLAKKVGLEVVYSDTDSVFVKNEPNKIQAISREVEKTLGLEIKPDEVYTRILFTEAKKKYCGLLPDGRLDIVGLEVVRGDWAACAKSVQERVLVIILKKQAPKDAVEFVREYIVDLRQKKVPYKDLIIWKTLTKPAKDYAVKAPHVEAAKRLLKEGYELSMGDKIGYVITVGAGKLYEKAKPYALASYDEVDVEYYVTNQVVPAALRILTMFGISENELSPTAEAGKPKTLAEFTND
jgi:DNA polymerase I